MRSMEKVPVDHRLGKAMSGVCGEHSSAEAVERLAVGDGDLRLKGVQKRERCEHVLAWAAFTPGVLAAPPPGRLTDSSSGKECSRPSRSAMTVNLRMSLQRPLSATVGPSRTL